MGKHSRRKPSYLPKVAVGAAPLALLLAGPASALATQTDPSIPLPLDHQREGSLDRGVGFTSEGDTTVFRGFLTNTERNVFSKDAGDVKTVADVRRSVSETIETRDGVTARPDKVGALAAAKTSEAVKQGQREAVKVERYGSVVAGNETEFERTGARLTEVSLDPRTGVPTFVSQDSRGLRAAEGTYHAVRPLPRVGVINETKQQVGGGLDRAMRVDGGFSGDLGGVLEAGRSSGHAVDVGDLAAVGSTSAQHGNGRFGGVLPLDVGSGAGYGQEHALGGAIGPSSGLVTTGQNGNLAHHGAGLSGSGSHTISGDLGIGEVASVRGTSTSSVRGVLPATDPAQAGHLTQSGTLDLTLLGQPAHTGFVAGALPLELKRS
ncbi:hypothetical protein SAMN04489729_5194 [Amycolatopsis lurida]|uniref:Uncharacterized protein n=1 Tax=Amycolatopsis lurida NRRL 2430 TaxID=1460371 RepID=A0A2P2FSR2_AMYLU|nr:hypothetical protein [Amycolatopsis lurida]KFU79756.1 hypothetical protein BB31_18130 [Amycolatopsis lurida NRRL 2430]SED76761.1 hypothetical protein SAMN04489729_5194 [Amycolatopsis lurida]